MGITAAQLQMAAKSLRFSSASASFQAVSGSLEVASTASADQTAADAHVTCAQCGGKFDEHEWDFMWHAKNKQHKAYMCPLQGCGKGFIARGERDAHQRRPHLEGHERVETGHPFACVVCSKPFKNKSKLQEHANEAQHHPFSYSCGKSFARLDVLNRHLDSMGTDMPKYPCLFCKSHRDENGFRRRDHLLQHVRGYHKFEAEGKFEDILPSRRGKYQTPPVCHFADCLHHRAGNFKRLSREEQDHSKPFASRSEYTKHLKNARRLHALPIHSQRLYQDWCKGLCERERSHQAQKEGSP
ncbi:hypothetical protein CSAL01_10815 [Colletotrichum salicis]|uniref:C2H2-type domain-containing protein n=1 Tax=Colletotrichum salicis TaxID=1209931 RepID=A0A135SRC7_9PEZI|nr:hypothetical protein CSAL01_10815 [Colletotrichum salicis]